MSATTARAGYTDVSTHALLLPVGRTPPGRAVKIYPDSAHGFLFQHHAEFVADVHAFLGEPD
jgi:hypothetical protein